ncbi:unnamed protein product [Orchesella dallaii]|uniref:Ion transport domain-containing protein n=1 Tax=Orchesella dallaii TaxID=48710 RepID=A0ABP1S973_9HEXA
MGKKDKKDKKKGKSKPPSPTTSGTQGGGSRRGSNSSNYGAIPVRGSDSDSSVQNQPSSPTRQRSNASQLQRKPSQVVAPLSTLDEDEYDFFSMVSSGDVQGVTKYINSPDFGNKNINRFNKNGYTALHMAVRRQDEEMVNTLLKIPNIQLYDIILHAIREDNLEITKLLLKINDKLMREDGTLPASANQNQDDDDEENKARPISSKSGISTSLRPINQGSRTSVTGLSGSVGQLNGSNRSVNSTGSPTNANVKDNRDEIPFDSEFHQVITPLMLAAQVGSTELMELFYKRGERLETPMYTHNIGCSCEICGKLDGDGDMTRVHQRYDLYKALCQPDYICLMAHKIKVDPVNYAIDKIVKIRDIMKRDQAYDQMYAEFIEELEKFCTDMLSRCRTTLETRVFLSPKDSQGEERLPHQNPRLWYTVGLNMKSFVAHPSTQNVVYHMWATDLWPDWETYGTIYRLFNLAIRVVTFPVIAMILFVADGTKLGKTLGSPIGRFMNYFASYLVFLALVVFQVVFPYQRCNDVEPYYTVNDDACKQRGPPNIGTEWPIIIYIFSFAASMLKRQSVSWFWKMRWNWYDVVFILSFMCTFACWLASWIWTQTVENETEISSLDRLMWPPYSPEVLGENFIAISTMFACGRLLRFLQIFSEIGPLQVIIGKQIASFISTAFMFLVLLVSFGSSLLALYAPYKEYTGLDDHHKLKSQDDSFSQIGTILPHLFTHLIDPGSAGELLTWENKGNGTEVAEEVHHIVTQRTGKVIITLYHIIGFLFMFNMLTGYFGQTMGDILSDSDRVWKYTRTELYLTHTKDTVLPPPFNLIPTLRTFGNALRYFTLLGKKNGPRAAFSWRQCCYITDGKKTDEWRKLRANYRNLILEIVFRYRKFRKDTLEKEQATRDDVLEIGEEIAELKEKILNDAKLGDGDENKDDSDDENFNNFPRRPPGQTGSKWGRGSGGSGGGSPTNVHAGARRSSLLSGRAVGSSAGAGAGTSSTRSNPAGTSQPQGSPQAGTSAGNTTFNMSPNSTGKLPSVPQNPPLPSQISFNQQQPSSSFTQMNVLGNFGSLPTTQNIQNQNNNQMGSYQNQNQAPPHKMKQRYSSSLMNLQSSSGDFNRNESDSSLFRATTIANATVSQDHLQHPFFDDVKPIPMNPYNYYKERFPWDESLKYQSETQPQGKTLFQGRLSNVDTSWDHATDTKLSPPNLLENVEQVQQDFGGFNTSKENDPFGEAQEHFPPPYFRGRSKEN